MIVKSLLMSVIALQGAITPLSAEKSVPRSECFPVERLDTKARARAESLLLKMLDGEALFTLVGGLKPMSSGWISHRIKVEEPDMTAAELDRVAISALRSGDEVFCTLQPFTRIYEGTRYLDGFLYHRDSVRAKVTEKAKFFGYFGLSASSHPVEVTMAFEVDDTSKRNRGYGYLFGYPDHAVDFFVQADDEGRKTKQLVPRDFLHIPTFESPTNRFVYAVPKGHQANEADLDLKKKAEPILAYYRKQREKYVGEGKPGVVALLRDWFDDGKGRCSSATALAKAIADM